MLRPTIKNLSEYGQVRKPPFFDMSWMVGSVIARFFLYDVKLRIKQQMHHCLFLLCFLNLQKVPTSNTEGGWSFSLAEYVRHSDMPIYEASERVLRAFQDELMPAESLSEFFDVVGQCPYAPD